MNDFSSLATTGVVDSAYGKIKKTTHFQLTFSDELYANRGTNNRGRRNAIGFEASKDAVYATVK